MRVTSRESPVGAKVLTSRSELRDGGGESPKQGPFEIIPTGSIAYTLALVAQGRADATSSLAPKNE